MPRSLACGVGRRRRRRRSLPTSTFPNRRYCLKVRPFPSACTFYKITLHLFSKLLFFSSSSPSPSSFFFFFTSFQTQLALPRARAGSVPPAVVQLRCKRHVFTMKRSSSGPKAYTLIKVKLKNRAKKKGEGRGLFPCYS